MSGGGWVCRQAFGVEMSERRTGLQVEGFWYFTDFDVVKESDFCCVGQGRTLEMAACSNVRAESY